MTNVTFNPPALEADYKIRELKNEGRYSIDKVTYDSGEVIYDVYYFDAYDADYTLVNSFRSLKEARQWARMMSE